MSKEKNPILAGAIPTIEHFMTNWEWLAVKQPRLAPAIWASLKVANKYYQKMDDTQAYIVAMCK